MQQNDWRDKNVGRNLWFHYPRKKCKKCTEFRYLFCLLYDFEQMYTSRTKKTRTRLLFSWQVQLGLQITQPGSTQLINKTVKITEIARLINGAHLLVSRGGPCWVTGFLQAALIDVRVYQAISYKRWEEI